MNGAAAFFHPRYGWFLMLTIIQFVKDVMHLLCVGLAILDPEARYGQICQNVKFHSGSPSIVCTLDDIISNSLKPVVRPFVRPFVCPSVRQSHFWAQRAPQ